MGSSTPRFASFLLVHGHRKLIGVGSPYFLALFNGALLALLNLTFQLGDLKNFVECRTSSVFGTSDWLLRYGSLSEKPRF